MAGRQRNGKQLRDQITSAVICEFPGADRKRIDRYADVMAEGLQHSGLFASQRLLTAAPSLFSLDLSEQDLRMAIGIVNRVFKDDRFMQLSGEMKVSTIGKLLKATDEMFVLRYLHAASMLVKHSPLAALAYFSDEVAEGILKNHFSPAGILKWCADVLERSNGGKATDILLDLLFFDQDAIRDMDLSQFAMRGAAVFYEDMAEQLEALVRQHYNRTLRVMKSLEGTPHTAEGNEIDIFLPFYIDNSDSENANRIAYFIFADHEAGHHAYGSFRAVLPAALDYLRERGKEVRVRKLEFADSASMKLKSITYEYHGKTYLATSMLGFLSMFGDEHAPFVKDLWNCIEDGKDDAWWLDEKAYGLRKEYMQHLHASPSAAREDGARQGAFFDYSATGIRNTILMFVRGYAGATDRNAFVRAVFDGNIGGINEHDRCMVELIRSADQKTLEFLGSYSNELINVIMNRVYHTTPVFLLALKIVEDIRQLVKKGELPEPKPLEAAKDGRIGGTGVVELDPENIRFEIGEGEQDIPLSDLPEDLKKAFVEKHKKFIDSLDRESRENLMRRAGKPETPVQPVTFDRDMFVLEYDPLLSTVSPLLQVPIHITAATNCESMAEQETAGWLATIFRRLTQPRTETIAVDEGEEFNIDRRYEWVLDRRRGIMRPRDYHEATLVTETRDTVIQLLGDASGSTSGMLNGRRVIDYLTGGVHTTVTALSDAYGPKFGYAFYQSSGLENGTTIYIGKAITETEMRYRKVEPGAANRDGAARRVMLKLLEERPEPVKVLIVFCDSLPADDNYENGTDDVRDARVEGERKGIIQYTITTPVNKSNIPQFESPEKFYAYLYGEHYYVINSVRDLQEAFGRFFTSIIGKLRTTRIA